MSKKSCYEERCQRKKRRKTQFAHFLRSTHAPPKTVLLHHILAFEMNSNSLSEIDANKLEALLLKVQSKTENFLGYPVSKDFDYSALLPFLQYPLNNLGDPFVDSTYAVDSREMEKEVVQFFAELFRAQPDNWWGYVTNGGSEGNLYGLYLAR